MIRRLFDKVFGFLGVGYGWCGGCSDPDCDDCATEWTDESRRDDFEREVLGDGSPSGIGRSVFGADIEPAGQATYPYLEEPVGYDGFGAPLYPHQVGE